MSMADEKARERGALTVSLLGREFRVACPDGEEKQLLASADYLNRGNERIAIMAALNIAHEFMSKPAGASAVDATAISRRITAMQETLEAALAADQEKLF